MVTTRKASGSLPNATSAAAAPANGASAASKAKGKGKAAPAASAKAGKAKRTREEESSDDEEEAAKPAAAKQAKGKKAVAAPAAKKAAKGSAEAEAETSKRATDDEYSNSEDEDASDDDAVLAGFSDVSGSDDGGDSSDDDDDDSANKRGVISASGVVKLPSSKDDAVVRSRLEKVNKKRKERGDESTPIVLYFGRVPKTMPEDALRAYLVQFGDIRRLRLARNKKTGATKHYAFVEFADEDVGKIVCETMNNYLLEGRLLQVQVVPKEKVHPSLWIGSNRKYRAVPGDRRHRVLHDERPRTDEQKKSVERKLLARQKQRRDKIKAQGIDYDFEGYA